MRANISLFQPCHQHRPESEPTDQELSATRICRKTPSMIASLPTTQLLEAPDHLFLILSLFRAIIVSKNIDSCVICQGSRGSCIFSCISGRQQGKLDGTARSRLARLWRGHTAPFPFKKEKHLATRVFGCSLPFAFLSKNPVRLSHSFAPPLLSLSHPLPPVPNDLIATRSLANFRLEVAVQCRYGVVVIYLLHRGLYCDLPCRLIYRREDDVQSYKSWYSPRLIL
jgi:hypothetical protein